MSPRPAPKLTQSHVHTTLPRHGDRRTLRIGLLGGSFNPAHAGHLHIARTALAKLHLDQVWLLVSPGNPLKPQAGMAPLPLRLASARAIADGRRIIATDIETHLHTRYTVDTLTELHRRFPRAQFVWLMGADNLTQFPRWRGWRAIAATTQIAVLPRPTYNHRALASLAARRMRAARLPAHAAAALAQRQPPAWVFLPVRQTATSATAIRQSTGFPHRAPPFPGDDP